MSADNGIMAECGGGITAPAGYLASGVHAGVKKARKDVALVVSTVPASAAAVFTTNVVVAAPLVVDRIQLERSARCRALVVNSGNANACTGDRGLADAWAMVRSAAAALGVPEEQVLVSSTGVIGQFLPLERVLGGIVTAARALSAAGHADAAEAIRTTDTFAKELAVRTTLGGVPVTLGGMAKGSGMIAPNMATMLAFVTTDARVAPPLLRRALRTAADRTFNRITVDGDTSTNDMVTLFANGLAGNAELRDEADPGYPAFAGALEHLLLRLSRMIVTDGEGATKTVEIRVTGAPTEEEAVRAARVIANSSLVKTAIHGEDANWGRILAALGRSGVDFDPAAVEIFFDDVPILRKNYGIEFSEEDARRVLARKELTVRVELDRGAAAASVWTCDLSREYVSINASYRS